MEAGRSRADDYYLAEGTGFAERYSVTADGQVRAMPQLDGEGYEAWVSGVDPDTGEPRGRVRTDEHALRFAEVVVNGPKSWSIAAELHPDIAQAYAGAQNRAAEEIVAWMGRNATTRVGPRGGQVSTPVQRLEAVAVQHHTSRAGDPHRHIHLQINARVFAQGKWRGIDSVAVRNSIGAVQGIGHAAVVTDPQFRQALAGHGFTLDPDSGEVVELAGYVEAFSKRAEQINHQVQTYEDEWRAANPHAEPGPARRRSWDARAWVEHRPGKAHVEPGQVLHERWLDELEALGYQPPTRPAPILGISVGQLDRDEAAAEVLARLTAARSAWNSADIRGEVELLLARHGVIAAPQVRAELAEDITARAAGSARPLPGLTRDAESMPGHIRFWTSTEAIAVEQDLTGRLAARAASDAVTGRDAGVAQVARAAAAAGVRLDPAQAEAAAALAGDHALVLVTGAAGAGKTTTLATVRAALDHDGQQLLVVTPTLKAARGARVETGAQSGTVAWLIYQHGWRQDDAGRWTRLATGEPDTGRWARPGSTYQGPREDARLRAGDLVVVDEAGMLDQDTARALLVVADEQRARLALVGDPHQLPAIGRGGVLDLAGRWAERACTLDVIHRFTHTVQIEPGVWADVEDTGYAALSLAMRDGAAGDPGGVFDALAARGQVHTYPNEAALRQAVATDAAAAHRTGHSTAVSVATNDQAATLNAAIRDQLVASGEVDDGNTGHPVAITGSGQRVGVGDRIVTRNNDRDVDVANRDTWTVRVVHADGALTVTPTSGSPVAGTGLIGERTLPAGYVNRHVQLGYAGTIHGVQGETAHTAHLVLDEHTGAGAAYVGMTRGRTANTVHLVASDFDDARAQWIDTAGRGRADLGLEAARVAAEREASPYAGVAPPPGPQLDVAERDRLTTAPAVPAARVDSRLVERLRAAWREQEISAAQLEQHEPQLANARAAYERALRVEAEIAPLRQTVEQAQARAEQAAGPAATAQQLLDQRAAQIEKALLANWNQDRPVAGDAARLVAEGPGRFGRITGGRGAVDEATGLLGEWAEKWRPVVDQLRDVDTATNYAGRHPGNDDFVIKVRDYATDRAAQELPHAARDVTHGQSTATAAEQAQDAYQQTVERQAQQDGARQAFDFWNPRRLRSQNLTELAQHVTELGVEVDELRQRHERATETIDELAHSPAVQAQPDPAAWLSHTRHTWLQDREQAQQAAATRAAIADAQAARDRMHHHEHDQPYYQPDHGREGPSLGR